MKTWNKIEVCLQRDSELNINNSLQGETLETKVQRITEIKEPITDGSPIIYTDRKEGVKAEYNIRTDRFDIALDAMDKVNRTNLAKRMQVVEKENSSNDKPKPENLSNDKPKQANNEIA